MITRFADLSDAVLFTAMRREEGCFAELVHLEAGHLWGPWADWGFAVVHSETPAEEVEPPPGFEWLPASANRAGFVVLAMAAVVSVSIGVVGLLGFLSLLLSSTALLFSFVLHLILAAAFFLGATLFGNLMIRAHRDPIPRGHQTVLALCKGIGWMLVLFSIL